MEARMDLFADVEDTTDPTGILILTRIRMPILGCGTAVLLRFRRGEEEISLGFCSPDELRTAMQGVAILPVVAERRRLGY